MSCKSKYFGGIFFLKISRLNYNISLLNYFRIIPLSTDPLREINSYNHRLPDDNGQNNLENNNNYHFRTSYEYEPHNNENGVDEYKGNI